MHYLLYKAVVVAYLLAFYIWNHVDIRRHENQTWKYWIYLTDWGYEIFIWKMVLDICLVSVRYKDLIY